MFERAYSLLTVKSLASDARQFSGIASTPEVDRHGDVIDPAGLEFKNPVPLLLHHDQSKPVGFATLTATPDGIVFDGALPDIAEPGAVQSRIDEAWHSIKARLLTGVSLGIRILQSVPRKGGGRTVTRAEIGELSLVTIPANAHASILTVKSLAAPPRAKDPKMKHTASEYVSALEAKRAATVARMAAIMDATVEGETTTDDAQKAEYATLSAEVKAIDGDLVNWRELAALNVTKAEPVIVPQARPLAPVAPRQVSVRPNVPPGTSFVRMACAILECKGNRFEAAEYARRWDDSTPEVALALKAAVAPGTSTDAVWAGPLVQPNISSDFLALLRPATILGKVSGFRVIPFNTKVPGQTAGGTYGWVGEQKPKAVTSLAFNTQTLGIAKAAGIVILTDELVRLSSPSAEALTRDDMVKGIAQFLDTQFTDPTVAAVAGVHPASITNGAATAVATANPRADLLNIISHFAGLNVPLSGLTVIMSPANALAMSFYAYADGSPMFPGLTVDGGNYRGINVIASNAVGGNIIAFQPSLILYADDGGVTIDASREASVQMDSAPMSPADATTVYVSLWQNNLVGLRAERYVNWLRANANAVYYLTAANYPAPSLADVPPTKSAPAAHK
jgi:HK97 family phage major capsid protein/HK97 family phage prohead protease